MRQAKIEAVGWKTEYNCAQQSASDEQRAGSDGMAHRIQAKKDAHDGNLVKTKLDLLGAYHRLPHSLRSVAVTLQGFNLARWRYGKETETLVREALERESWSRERWKTFLEERLAYVLHRAATRVPYYRRQWEARRLRGDRASWDRLENWPILTKEALRESPREFVAEDCNTRKMFVERTSGTTAKPLTLWWSRRTVRAWYALFEARWRRWYGVSREDRWGIFGGQLVVPFKQEVPPFWVWNVALRQLYLSSYHLKPSNIEAYLEAMRHHEIVYLLGYPSAMSVIAQMARDKKLSAPQLKVVVSNAEPLYRHQRESIEEVFGCPVRDTYGMAEIVCAAGECEHGNKHLWPEVGHTEVLGDNDEEPVAESKAGRLVCTGLLNDDMPLVRYEVGDRVRLGRSWDECACKRTLPLVSTVEGRCDDVIVTPDGRSVGRLDPVFKSGIEIVEAQIVQVAANKLQVYIVPLRGFTQHDKVSIVENMRARVGNMQIDVELVEQIPRYPNGKFRAVVNQMAP